MYIIFEELGAAKEKQVVARFRLFDSIKPFDRDSTLDVRLILRTGLLMKRDTSTNTRASIIAHQKNFCSCARQHGA